MSEWDVVIVDAAPDADVAELRAAMHAFNFAATGYRGARSLSCFVRNDGELIAGIDGFTWGGYARIDYLWVIERLRRRGLGTQLLSCAEAEACRRGCTTVVLDTHSFQAPDLYRARGYIEVGTTVDTPRGYSQTLFQKQLSMTHRE
ncbi:MAG: GNAT family N-acetyltransferase [Acidimicrobiia bacterium]